MLQRLRFRIAQKIYGKPIWTPGHVVVTRNYIKSDILAHANMNGATPEEIETIQRILDGRTGLFNVSIDSGLLSACLPLIMDHAVLANSVAQEEER